MRRAGNTNLFCHRAFPPSGFRLLGHAARWGGDACGREGRKCADGMTCAWPAELTACGRLPQCGAAKSKGFQVRQTFRNGDPKAESLWPTDRLPLATFRRKCATSGAPGDKSLLLEGKTRPMPTRRST